MSNNYRNQRFRPQTDPDNYAAIVAALKADERNSRVFGAGYEEIPAPTRGIVGRDGRTRPRAWKCGYNRNTGTLVIIMRDYTWIQYDEVPAEMWDDGLKIADSTNEFVQEALLNWPYKKSAFGSLPRTRPESFEAAVEANQGYYDRYGPEGAPNPNY
jgi:hypothetical protein